MRLAGAIAVLAATVAAATSAVATASELAVEAHFLSRVAVDAVGWWAYGSASILVLAVGIRVLSALPFSDWGVWAVAAAKTVDALRDVWLVGPGLAGADLVIQWSTLVAIIGAGALGTYAVTRQERWYGSRYERERSTAAVTDGAAATDGTTAADGVTAD